jgi:hypothetical protein
MAQPDLLAIRRRDFDGTAETLSFHQGFLSGRKIKRETPL